MTTVRMKYGAMTAAVEALASLGRGRGADQALQFARLKVAIQRARDAVDDERKALIAQHTDNPLGFSEDDEVPDELRKAINTLMGEDVKVEVRELLSLSDLRSARLKPKTEDSADIATLIYLGILEDDLDESA